MFGQDGPYSPRPGPRPGRHRLRRPAAPHRLPRPAAGARRRHDLRLPHRRVRRAGRGRARSTRATRAAASGAVIDAALYGAALRILEWTLAGYDRLGVVRNREGNRLANSAPLDNYPTARRQVRVHRRRLRRELRAAVQGDGPARPARRPALRQARRPRRAQRRDQRHRRRVDGDARRDRDRERCVAHDVPVATAYTAADIFADPHMEARADLVTVDDPVIGPVRQQAPFPRVVGRAAGARRPARRGSARTPARCSARSASPTPSSTTCARRGSCDDGVTADRTTACSSSHDDGTIDLVGGYSPTSGRFHFPLLDTCPYSRRDRRRARAAVARRRRCGRGPRSPRAPPGYEGPVPFGFGVVELDARAAPRRHPADRVRSGAAARSASR